MNMSLASDNSTKDIESAYVTFAEDQEGKIVSVIDIFETVQSNSHIRPQHDKDFRQNFQYQVKWFYCGTRGDRCSKSHAHQYRFHPAVIDYLGDTNPDEQSDKSSRKKVSNCVALSTEQPKRNDIAQDTKKRIREKHKAQKNAAQKRAREQLETAMNTIPVKVANTFMDSSDSGDDGLPLQSLSDGNSSGSDAESVSTNRFSSLSQSIAPITPPIKPCSVRLNAIPFTPSTADVSYPADLPLGARLSNSSESQKYTAMQSGIQMAIQIPSTSASQLSGGVLSDNENDVQGSSQKSTARMELEDATAKAAEAAALLASLREAQEAARRRVELEAAMENEPRIQDESAQVEHQQILARRQEAAQRQRNQEEAAEAERRQELAKTQEAAQRRRIQEEAAEAERRRVLAEAQEIAQQRRFQEEAAEAERRRVLAEAQEIAQVRRIQEEAAEAERRRVLAEDQEAAQRLRILEAPEEHRRQQIAQDQNHEDLMARAGEMERRRLLGVQNDHRNIAGQQRNEENVDIGARMLADGYGRPARFDRRGRLIREARSRRQLAITVYDLYHKPGGPFNEERLTWRYRVIGQRMHLTETITVDNIRFGLINRMSGKTFISATARILFTPAELLDSALDPTQVRNIVPGRGRPRVIDRERLLLLMSLYHDYVFGEHAITTLRQREQALLKGCHYLSRFLCDFRSPEIRRLEDEGEGVNLNP